MIEIVLAGPPMGKERVRFVRATGRAFTPERTVNYEGRLALAAQAVMAGRPLLTGPIRADVVVLMPITASKPRWWKLAAAVGAERPTKKPDWDNFGKILDALNLIVWADDAQVVDGRVRKYFGERPGLVARLTPITEQEQPPEWALAALSGMTTDDEGVLS